MAFDPRRVSILEVAGIVTIILSLALIPHVVIFYDEYGHRPPSSRSRRAASLSGFFDLSHARDGPLR